MAKRLIKYADDTHEAKMKLLEITKFSDNLLSAYVELYNSLNDLYSSYPQLYEEIQKTVQLPTNEDAQQVTAFNEDLKKELQYLDNDNFLHSVLSDEDITIEDSNENS